MRLRRDIAVSETADGLLLRDERKGRDWQLNATGAFVLRALLAGRAGEQVTQSLARRRHIDPGEARRDVTALTDYLHAARLVETP
jgi:coenzyme PQQ synthesis protein D (PqqD)